MQLKKLVDGIQKGEVYQTLEGVTGSGKTFTVANVINKLNKQTCFGSQQDSSSSTIFGIKRLFSGKPGRVFRILL